MQPNLKHNTCTLMKKLCFILIFALPLLFIACSHSTPGDNKPDPHYWGTETFPGTLKMNNIHLDTVTPPLNPLHPLTTEVAELPAYYGYLDCARFKDNKRYCALIGLGSGRNIYFLTDNQWNLIRYDSPILAECHVGELMYIRGYLTEESKSSNETYLLLQVVDIERTDSIVPAETILRW